MTTINASGDIEALRASLAKAEAQAQAEAEARAAERAEALRRHDEQTLARFSPTELNQRVRHAEQHLREVIWESPIGKAAAEVYAERVLRAHAHSEATASRSRLGQPTENYVPPVADLDLVDILARAVMAAGEDLAEERRQKAEADLERKLAGH